MRLPRPAVPLAGTVEILALAATGILMTGGILLKRLLRKGLGGFR